jgi:hypothetical protein
MERVFVNFLRKNNAEQRKRGFSTDLSYPYSLCTIVSVLDY